MSNYHVRSVDIGYGNVKLIADDEGSLKLFPSLAPRAELDRSRLTHMRERQTSRVWVGNECFEVGSDTRLFTGEEPVLHSDYTETAEYRALYFGALDQMGTATIDHLVTGLPVHLHQARAARLKNLLIGHHQIRPDKAIEVVRASVIPQPLGGLISYCHFQRDWAEAQKQTFLLVDPGYFTFDWLVTRGLAELPGRSGSIECGVSAVLRHIQTELNRDFGDTLTNLRRLDDGLHCGQFQSRGRTIDLSQYMAHARPTITRAVRAMHNQIGNAHEVDQIVIVGGGARLFANVVRDAFPQHPLAIVEEPVFANVRGYQLIGQLLRKREQEMSKPASVGEG